MYGCMYACMPGYMYAWLVDWLVGHAVQCNVGLRGFMPCGVACCDILLAMRVRVVSVIALVAPPLSCDGAIQHCVT